MVPSPCVYTSQWRPRTRRDRGATEYLETNWSILRTPKALVKRDVGATSLVSQRQTMSAIALTIVSVIIQRFAVLPRPLTFQNRTIINN